MGNDYVLLGLVLFPMIGAIVSYILGRYHKRVRDYAVQIITGSELAACLWLLLTRAAVMGTASGSNAGSYCEIPDFAGLGISFRLDGFRLIYIVVLAFMWAVTSLFSQEYFKTYRNRNRYYLFVLLTLGAAMGVFLSADLYTTFLFFELLSLTSYAWVAHEEKPEALRAAATYLGIAIIGGLVMLMGLFLYVDIIGSARYDMLVSPLTVMDAKAQQQLRIAGLCFLVGFGAKAGAFPLHIWLPKAHPVAPAPASALLSGALTKTGVFGILVITCNLFVYDQDWGILLLIIGTVTMLLGAVLALLSVDLKRTLACSSMSQIGFILIGTSMMVLLGEENVLAVRGTLMYMVNHSLFKLVLFLAAGAVFMNVHRLNLNEIRGFGRKKPLLHGVFLLGMLGISGVPLGSGYISKTLLHESIVEYRHGTEGAAAAVGQADMQIVEWLFLICGGMTLAYMLKLYICLFFEKNCDPAIQQQYDERCGCYLEKKSAAVLLGGAVLIPLMGLLPYQTLDRLADLGQDFCYPVDLMERVPYFSLTNLQGAAASMLIGVLLYLVVVKGMMCWKKRYYNLCPAFLDLENVVYRPILLHLVPILLAVICRILDRMVDYFIVFMRKTVFRDSPIPHELEEGTVVTHTVGLLLDDGVSLLNRSIFRKKPVQISYEHKLATFREMLGENNVIIARSLSFGLMMFGIGLMLTLLYMLY